MFGPYQVAEELYLSPVGAVARAKRMGDDEGVYVIKRFNPPVDDPSEPHWDHAIFLDRARAQQQLVAGGAQYWVAVYQVGVSDSGAWFASDYLPLSAQKLIAGKVEIKSAPLYSIVSSIVSGLTELRAARRRAHGNLKPSNVLFAGTDLSSARVLLSDLGSPAQAAKAGEAGDLLALGQLIYELVTHQPFSEQQPWPLEDSPQWQKLGRDGDAWRQLCSDLIVPVAALRPPLEVVAARIEPLQPRQTKPRLRRMLVAAMVPLALAAAGVLTLSILNHNARNQFARSRQQWFGELATAISDPARSHRFASDPSLQRLLADIHPEQIQRLQTQSSGMLCWNPADYRAAAAANAMVRQVETDLTPEHWQTLQQAAELKENFETLAWPQPTEVLGKLIDAVRPGPGAHVASGIDRLIDVVPKLRQQLDYSQESWKRLATATTEIQARNDRALTAMAGFLRGSAAAGIELTDSGLHGFDQVRQNARLAERLADAIRLDFPGNVQTDRLMKDVADNMDLERLQRGDVEQYLRLLALNTVRRDETLATAESLKKRLDDTVTLVSKSHPDQREQKELETETAAVVASLREFGNSSFTSRALADGTFAARRTDLEARIDSLRKFYHADGAEDWLKTLPVLSTSSQRINAYWEAWRRLLHDSVDEMNRDRDVFAAYQQRASRLRELLTALDKDFPQSPKGLSESFTATAQKRREETIEKLLPLIDPGSAKLDPVALKLAQSSYGEWSQNLAELASDFPIQRQVLLLDERPDRKWEGKTAFWKDPAIQSLVKADVERIHRLQALRGLGRDELARTAQEAKEPEVTLAAWQLLGSGRTSPIWPGKPGELAAELAIRTRLAESLKDLRAREADAIAVDIRRQTPLRWKRFVEHATSEAMLDEAVKNQRQYNISTADVAALKPAARYNLWAFDLNRGVALGNDELVQDSLNNIRTAASEIKDEPLLARLAMLDVKEAFAGQQLGESARPVLPGVQPPIEFRRVQPGSGRPFYLATTEISFQQFVQAVQGAGAWDQMKKLPWAYDSMQKDPRRGPRVWEWTGQAANPMSSPQYWLTPDDDNDFPLQFRAGRFNRMVLATSYGGPPEPEHPMQQISAQAALYYAALCGCRLPSVREWQAAYEQFEKSGSTDHWNLRDQTWEEQRKYLAQTTTAHSLDEGIFRAEESDESHPSHDAKALVYDDRTLYFRHVNSPASGSVFRHLVGNVAEYMCNAPEKFDAWPDRKTAQGIQKFVAQSSGSFFVIGGSALSPPQVPLDQPLALAHTDRGYADVGLRLAFTAPSRTLAERVKWTVGEVKYIWPTDVALLRK